MFLIIPLNEAEEIKIPLIEIHPGEFFLKSKDQYPIQQKRLDQWIIEHGNVDSSQYHEMIRQTSKGKSPNISGRGLKVRRMEETESFPDHEFGKAQNLFQKNDDDNFHMTKHFRKELQQEMGIPDSSSDGSAIKITCDVAKESEHPPLVKNVF